MKTEITLQWLEEHNAYSETIEWFKKSVKESIDARELIGKLISTGEQRKIIWVDWLIVELMNKNNRSIYAIHAIESAFPVYEKKFPNCKVLKQAIAAYKKYFHNNNENNKKNLDIAYRTIRSINIDVKKNPDARSLLFSIISIVKFQFAHAVSYAADTIAYHAYPDTDDSKDKAYIENAIKMYNETIIKFIDFGIKLLNEEK